jgi:hypothetical protein
MKKQCGHAYNFGLSFGIVCNQRIGMLRVLREISHASEGPVHANIISKVPLHEVNPAEHAYVQDLPITGCFDW